MSLQNKININLKTLPALLFLSLILVVLTSYTETGKDVPDQTIFEQGIKPDSVNFGYWNYRGKTIMLLGGSSEDNLFQIDSLGQQ